MRVSRFLNFETTSKKKTPGALAASTRDPVLLRVDRHSESLRSVPMFRVIIILYAPINDYFVRSFTVRRGLRCDRSGFENNILKTIELYFFFSRGRQHARLPFLLSTRSNTFISRTLEKIPKQLNMRGKK